MVNDHRPARIVPVEDEAGRIREAWWLGFKVGLITGGVLTFLIFFIEAAHGQIIVAPPTTSSTVVIDGGVKGYAGGPEADAIRSQEHRIWANQMHRLMCPWPGLDVTPEQHRRCLREARDLVR